MINKDDFIQKSIINDMSEGVMIIGLDGNIKYINPAALSILNKNEAEMTGKNFASVFFCDEKNDLFNQTILDTISDTSAPHYNLLNYDAGDTNKTIYIMTSFLKKHSKKVALIVMLNDMTSIAEMRRRYTDQLIKLLESLVQALSVAIEERSQYNANHTHNMVKMAEEFLLWLDKTDNLWQFDKNKKNAFIMSVWLHDVGKLSVPLKVMDKATRLGNSVEKIDDRFGRIHLLNRLALAEKRITQEEYDTREENRKNWLDFIHRINTSGFLSDEDSEKIYELSALKYTEEDDSETPFITVQETNCLLIKKGTLTDEERKIMQNHVTVTKKILDRVDFPNDYKMVPEWAGSHHELKNGKGYPEHKQGDDIPKEVCLLTILDIFEALTAKDRPYKKPVPIEKAWAILHSMADEGSLDNDILSLFEKSEAWKVIL
ncbi:MAG: HD domain-containing protein [Clostridia bacterium]|nr:HD domain-containing protein [Clostridia bacterium]